VNSEILEDFIDCAYSLVPEVPYFALIITKSFVALLKTLSLNFDDNIQHSSELSFDPMLLVGCSK